MLSASGVAGGRELAIRRFVYTFGGCPGSKLGDRN
jgi:hypothetical protein